MEEKHPDYFIVAANYLEDLAKQRIEKVQVKTLDVILEESFGEKEPPEPQILTRDEVVTLWERGKTFKTYPGDLSEGEWIHIVKVNNEKFIRTDPNETEEDNLGELPQFEE